MAHVKRECNYGEGIEGRAGQDAPPTVSSENNKDRSYAFQIVVARLSR